MSLIANLIWVDKGSELSNKSMKSCLQDNDIEMFSTNNEGNSVVAERFIRTLNNEIYKYMISGSKNVYNNKLNDIVNKYNNTHNSTTKMKPIDLKSRTYVGFNKKNNKEDSKFKINDYVIISKYKNIFAKGWSVLQKRITKKFIKSLELKK